MLLNNTMIKIQNLHKIYGSKKNQFEAVKGIDLEIQEGDSIAIIGKSGSGKSTLMHILAGLDRPSTGSITYNDKDLSSLNGKKLAAFRNQNIGFVFQQFFMQPNFSVLENVILPLKIRGMSVNARREKGMQALEMVEMKEKAQSKANDLSGGQKQRVCIARALVTEPSIIFADEPTGNLDTQTGNNIIDLLFKLNKEKGITLIIVTHDEDLAALCKRKVQIQDGKVVTIA